MKNDNIFVIKITEIKAGEIWDSYVYQSYFKSKEEIIDILKDYVLIDEEKDLYSYKDKYGTIHNAEIYELDDYFAVRF